MNGSRKSERPQKVEQCVILNAFVSSVDQDRMKDIKELADSVKIQKLARDNSMKNKVTFNSLRWAGTSL
jgi:hypothetical protein